MSFTNTSFTLNLNETEWFGFPYPSGNITNQTLLNFTTTNMIDVSEDEQPSLALQIFSYILLVVLCGFIFCCICGFTGIMCMECQDSHRSWYGQRNFRVRNSEYNSNYSYSSDEELGSTYTTHQVASNYHLEGTPGSNKETSWEPDTPKLIAETPIDEIVLPSGEDNIEWAKMNCSICLEEIDFSADAERKATQLSCGHIYHQDCISEWYFGGVTSVSKCPLCRERMDRVVIQMVSI